MGGECDLRNAVGGWIGGDWRVESRLEASGGWRFCCSAKHRPRPGDEQRKSGIQVWPITAPSSWCKAQASTTFPSNRNFELRGHTLHRLSLALTPPLRVDLQPAHRKPLVSDCCRLSIDCRPLTEPESTPAIRHSLTTGLQSWPRIPPSHLCTHSQHLQQSLRY